MASSPSTDLNSSAAYEDDTPAPPGWKRKLVPRVGRGLTPTKTDVVYISPDGEEMKTKTQLQRYLRAHKGGPAVSEFNWSSGETPRRSGRITAKPPPDAMEVDVKPKNVKRKSLEIPQEETNAEQILSSPRPKHAKKGGKNVAVESKNTNALSPDTTLISIAAEKEEAVKEARDEEENLPNSETATKPVVAANGDAQESKKDENLEVQDKNLEALETVNNEEIEHSGDAKNLEPSGSKLEISEKINEISEPVSDEIAIEKEETVAINLQHEEPLEVLHLSSTAADKDLESQEITAESCPRKKDEKESLLSEANHHEERADVEGTVQDDEKGMQEGNDFAEEAEVVN